MKNWNDRLNEMEANDQAYLGNIFGWRFSIISATLIVLMLILMLWSRHRNEELGVQPVRDTTSVQIEPR
ncbi:MAG: hypothetical protein KDC57_04980 [Saprospiraceae bacterium]|nr:hypothetical protein [Saprospiraceae bacterium]